MHITQKNTPVRRYLVASDFDQTLSFNDSGVVLSELLGTDRFHEKVAGLSRANFVQQGAELAYLLLHDPQYRRVRKEHLIEVGRRIRLKRNIDVLTRLLAKGIGEREFVFTVISAAPEEVIQSALEGIVPPERIHGTKFEFDPDSGEIRSIVRVPAGFGKVAVLDELQRDLGITRDRVVYIGDGSSDVHVMLHVNRRDGLTIAVSETRYITQIARRTVLSEDAASVLVPIVEELAGWDPAQIRDFFESEGLVLQEWDRVRTDWLTIRPRRPTPPRRSRHPLRSTDAGLYSPPCPSPPEPVSVRTRSRAFSGRGAWARSTARSIRGSIARSRSRSSRRTTRSTRAGASGSAARHMRLRR